MDTVVHKIGRRKTSVARIYLKKGKGTFTVNTKDWKDYFPNNLMVSAIWPEISNEVGK